MKLFALLLPALLAGMPFAAAQSVPSTIPFQGRLLESGANYSGNGFFKFALLDTGPNPDVTLWSNDNSSVNASEPLASETITVTDGYYSVQLGGSSPVMSAIPREVLASASGPSVRLRVWFSKTSGGTFQQFNPDITVGSAPYALEAHQLEGLGPDDFLRLADLSNISANLALGTSQTLGIGTNESDISASVKLNGHSGHWRTESTVQAVIRKDGVSGITDLAGATAVAPFESFVSTGFNGLVVASVTDDSLTVFERTDTGALNQLYVIKDGVGGANRLNGVSDVAFLKYAGGSSTVWIAAVSPLDDGLTIFQLTATGFTVLSEVTDGAGGFTALDGARRLAVHPGRRVLCVSAPSETAVQITTWDNATGVLTPQSELRDGAGGFDLLAGVTGVALDEIFTTDGTGHLILGISASIDGAVTAANLDNPAAPVLTDTQTFSTATAPSAIAMVRGCAAVCSSAEGGVVVVEVSADGVISGFSGSTVRDGVNGFNSLAGADRITMAGRLVAVSAPGDQAVTLIDFSTLSVAKELAVFADGTAPFTDLTGPAGAAFLATLTVSGDAHRPAFPLDLDLFLTASTDGAVTWVRDSLTLAEVSLWVLDGVGIGTQYPLTDLEINDTRVDAGSDATLRLANSGSANSIVQLGEYNSGVFSGWDLAYGGTTGNITLGHQGFSQPAGTKFTLDRDGDLTITGTLTQGSDRARKENIVPADPAAILEKVAALPVSEWSYTGDGGVRHVGPMSQDFRAAFGLGASDKGIASVDADGVALAAIQALKAEMDALKSENAALRKRVERLESARPASQAVNAPGASLSP